MPRVRRVDTEGGEQDDAPDYEDAGAEPHHGRRRAWPARWTVAAVVVGLAATFLLDRATGAAPVQHLYYLPIILAALRLEWAGGLLASLSAIVLYHLANPALLTFAYRESDLVQIALFIAIGLATADSLSTAAPARDGDDRRPHRPPQPPLVRG